jgi:hypothetical protein
MLIAYNGRGCGLGKALGSNLDRDKVLAKLSYQNSGVIQDNSCSNNLEIDNYRLMKY